MAHRKILSAFPSVLAKIDGHLCNQKKTTKSYLSLNEKCINSLLMDEANNILLPTYFFETQKNRLNNRGSLRWEGSREALCAVAEKRVDMLMRFLGDARNAYESVFHNGIAENSKPIDLKVTLLSGDSHQGARRPILIEHDKRKVVLKFADPRPYLILSSLMEFLSDRLRIDLFPPKIIPSKTNDWYFLEYVEEPSTPLDEVDIEKFMFKLGVLVAAAYTLRMIDVHFENVLVYKKTPVIIDTECILYLFDEIQKSSLLLNTGLIGPSIKLSALRGGDTTLMSLHKWLSEDRTLRYHCPIKLAGNRLRRENKEFIDCSEYQSDVLSGFESAYRLMYKNKIDVLNIVKINLDSKTRIRYLMRKTIHYISFIEMMNLPSKNYLSFKNSIYELFIKSGKFSKSANSDLVAAELLDLDARDVPYFWVEAGDNWIFHSSGPVQRAEISQPIFEAVNSLFAHFGPEDLEFRLFQFRKFLTAPRETTDATDERHL